MMSTVRILPRMYNCKHQNKTKQNKKITHNKFKKQTYFRSLGDDT